jgi:putative ABC transport system permease protein
MQIAVRRGREFTRNDRAGASAVAVINETTARRFWPNDDPLGKRLVAVRRNQAFEIVGVVADVRPYGLSAQVEPEIYWPYMQQPRGASYFALRAHAATASLIAAVRERVVRTDPSVVAVNVATMDQLVSKTLRQPRFNMLLLSIFAAAALLLASVGLYGVMSYTVTQGIREFGIRVALGAQRSDVLKLVLGKGLVMVLIGIAVGLLAALALTRFLAGLLYGVPATDPWTFVGVALLLLLIALLACFIPARRATRVDPLVALRSE